MILAFPAAAQQRKSMATVGWLWYGGSPAGGLPTLESAVIDGLRELGYSEGKNLTLEHRFAQGRPERLLELAGDLAQQRVDAIVAVGGDLTARWEDLRVGKEGDRPRCRECARRR
jgi:putative ABC transport system substrate-binding protein